MHLCGCNGAGATGKKKELYNVSDMESLSEAEKRRKRNKKGKRKKIVLWRNAFYGAKHHVQIQHHPALTDWFIVPEL